MDWLKRTASRIATTVWDQVGPVLAALFLAALAGWAGWNWLRGSSQVDNWILVVLSIGWLAALVIVVFLLVSHLRAPRDLEVMDLAAGLRWSIKPEVRKYITWSSFVPDEKVAAAIRPPVDTLSDCFGDVVERRRNGFSGFEYFIPAICPHCGRKIFDGGQMPRLLIDRAIFTEVKREYERRGRLGSKLKLSGILSKSWATWDPLE